MPDPGDTKAGDRGQGTSSSGGLKGGNTSGVGGGGGGGGGADGSRGSSTGGVGAGNGSNAAGNKGGGGQGGQNSGVGRDSSRGLGQGAGGSAVGRGAGGQNTNTGGGGKGGVAGGKTDMGGGLSNNSTGVGGPGAGGMGGENSRRGSSTTNVGPTSGFSAPGNIGAGLSPTTGQQTQGVSPAVARADDRYQGIKAQTDGVMARSPQMDMGRQTPAQMRQQYEQYRAPPGAAPQRQVVRDDRAPSVSPDNVRAPTDVTRTLNRDLEAARGMNALGRPQGLPGGVSVVPTGANITKDQLFGTPSGFMSPEVKRETQYGYDTLYSPNDLNNLYKGINAFGIDDMERRIAAQQSLLGQTIDASQYGGRVTADLNNKIDAPIGSARTVDPFNADVITHWTGNGAPLARISGNGYATVIDKQGNINYNRAFDANGNMLNTNHTKGMNTGNFGIASQGIEPNAAQLDAARALGANWFNGNASVSTHGYEAGTRINNGDRPRSDIRNKDGSYSSRPDREGVGLASAFTGQDDVGKTWTRTTLGEDRPVTMASGLGQGTRENSIATARGRENDVRPASGPAYPGGDGITDGDIGQWGEERVYDQPIGPSQPPNRTYDQPLGPNMPPNTRYISDSPTLQQKAAAFNSIYGEPEVSTRVPGWQQSTYTGRPPAPTEINVDGVGLNETYDPLGSISAPPRPGQKTMHVVGGAGFTGLDPTRGADWGQFDAAKYTPEERDIVYGGGPTMTQADDPSIPAGPVEPSYINPMQGEPPEQRPKPAPESWVQRAPYIGPIAKLFSGALDFEWSRLSPDERANLMQKWSEQNKAYLSNGNLEGSRQEPITPTDGLFGNGSSAYIPKNANPPPPPPDNTVDPYGTRTRVGNPDNPYTYGMGPAFNYFTYT